MSITLLMGCFVVTVTVAVAFIAIAALVYLVHRLPLISIAPVTEWMEQERARIAHEAAKKSYYENVERKKLEQAQGDLLQAQAQAQQPAKKLVPINVQMMKKQNDTNVVGKYKIVKKGDK
jgi:uncharacterized membrane protein